MIVKNANDLLDLDLSPAPPSTSMSLDAMVTTEHRYAIHQSQESLKEC